MVPRSTSPLRDATASLESTDVDAVYVAYAAALDDARDAAREAFVDFLDTLNAARDAARDALNAAREAAKEKPSLSPTNRVETH